MATNTGKGKSKKSNKKTIPLSVFVAEDQTPPQGYNVVHTQKVSLDWADQVDDNDFDDRFTVSYNTPNKPILLPTGPKATRTPDLDLTRVPSDPPFKAYLGNLPYDVSQQEITRYFSKLEIIDVRLPLLNGRHRGFAYAEFGNKDSLIEALQKNGDMFRNRQLKVGLPGDNESSTGNRENPREERQDRTAGDWRTAPRDNDVSRDPPNRDNYGFRNGMNDNSYDRQRNQGSDSSYGRNRFENERTFRPSNDRNYERSNNYSNERFGRSNDREFDRSNNRYSNRNDERFDDSRDNDRSSFGRRIEDSNRYSSRNYDDRRTDSRREFGGGFERSRRDDSQYDSRNGSPPPSKETYEEQPKESVEERPKERQKLQLKPRTKPIDESSESLSNSAIFGGAKPVNTAAREQEIEQKLLKEREESDKKSDNNEGRIRRISSSSNSGGRSRKGSESGQPRDSDEYRNSGQRRTRKTSERNSVNEPKYTVMPRNSNDSTHTSSRYSSSREPQRDRESRDQRYNSGRGGNSGTNRSNFTNNNRRDRHDIGSNRDHEKYETYDRPPRMSQKSEDEDERKVAYTTSNKFAHLNNEDYDEDEGANPSD
ncbi:eukaryotic translation initiation factor 4B-like [Oppia nitens]|uniref:eukaryotic translation initiation factor 4B-like n=1 Tax=Oppia nitens TaxID=1686743 RepID=UPI0023DB1544|nr:eukaryotic translation initiation factor 4B-like [Oppia nitens]